MLQEREWDMTLTNTQTYNASEHGSYGFHFRKSAAFSRKPREKSKFRMKGEYGMYCFLKCHTVYYT